MNLTKESQRNWRKNFQIHFRRNSHKNWRTNFWGITEEKYDNATKKNLKEVTKAIPKEVAKIYTEILSCQAYSQGNINMICMSIIIIFQISLSYQHKCNLLDAAK